MLSRKGEPELLEIRKVAQSSKWWSFVFTVESMRARIIGYAIQAPIEMAVLLTRLFGEMMRLVKLLLWLSTVPTITMNPQKT